MNIAIIGCGYVIDHYLKTLKDHPVLDLVGVTDLNLNRAQAVARQYKTKVYQSNETLLADPTVELVVNLTSVESHYSVNKACLLAGKHVYSEKPLTVDVEQAEELVKLAERAGLMLSGAPCNLLSDTIQTVWRAVIDGVIGRVKLVYAEFDDNPIYCMRPEGWTSASGVPWPYRQEYETGCTLEHAGYHLTWMCAIFGPATAVTAFSACLVPEKTSLPLDPNDTPDFSVGCISFQSGVVARLTCSIVAPLNHSMAVIGNLGVISTDTYRHYRSPVYIEHFTQITLNARKSRSVRASALLRRMFGVGGQKQRLVPSPRKSMRTILAGYLDGKLPIIGAMVKKLKGRELGVQDKLQGARDMADALAEGRQHHISPDFLVHITELTLAIANSRARGEPQNLKTTFQPLSPKRSTLQFNPGCRRKNREGFFSVLAQRLIERAHRH